MARFFMENGVYIETLTDVPLVSRPVGSTIVPQRPSPNDQWINGAWQYVAPVPPVPTSITKLQAKLAVGPDRRGPRSTPS